MKHALMLCVALALTACASTTNRPVPGGGGGSFEGPGLEPGLQLPQPAEVSAS